MTKRARKKVTKERILISRMEEIPDEVEMMLLNEIIPCRWSTGIRDKEMYERLRENMKIHGQDDATHIWFNENGEWEVFIGDHRFMVAKELKYSHIKVIKEEITLKEAMERCIGNNITHSKYSSKGLENLVWRMWKSGLYPSYANLGRQISLTGERIGQILNAKKIRDESKVTLDGIATQTIVNTSALESTVDKIALLKLVKEEKILPSHTKKIAQEITKWDIEKRNMVLYEGADYYELKRQLEKELGKKLPKKGKVTIPTDYKDLIPQIYNFIEGLGEYVATIEEKNKGKAIDYIKVNVGLLLEILKDEEAIDEKTYDNLLKDVLEIDKGVIHSFKGNRTKGVEYHF